MKGIEKSYQALLADIKARVRFGQYEALRAVNKELVSLYWDIGRMIIERQKGNTWGKSVVARLASDLQKEFPGVGGFSGGNLWRARLFYETYASSKKLAPVVREIAWSKNIIIMEKCGLEPEREFYLQMTRRHGWSKNILIHQIEGHAYEKTSLSQNNFKKTLPTRLAAKMKLALKDEYTFDFLELNDEYNEKQLEFAILAKVEPFLREMGGIFSFMGSQFRLEVKDKEYFIDLLLYHRHLKCLVAIELKVGEFIPEYVGKMQFYLTALDNHVRAKDENPSIGIILCKSKEKTTVEYALHQSNKPIGVATYQNLSKRLQKELPAPRQVEKLLDIADPLK